jgi:hypothetical protein
MKITVTRRFPGGAIVKTPIDFSDVKYFEQYKQKWLHGTYIRAIIKESERERLDFWIEDLLAKDNPKLARVIKLKTIGQIQVHEVPEGQWNTKIVMPKEIEKYLKRVR